MADTGTRTAVGAVAVVVGVAAATVAIAVLLAPAPDVLSAGGPGDVGVDVAVPEPELLEPPPPIGTFIEGRVPGEGRWAVAAQVGDDGLCIEAELMSERGGEGSASCGHARVRGIELNHLGPTPDGWVVLGGLLDPATARAVLRGADRDDEELELFDVEGHDAHAFGVAINRADGYEEVVAFDESGEVLSRRGIPRD